MMGPSGGFGGSAQYGSFGGSAQYGSMTQFGGSSTAGGGRVVDMTAAYNAVSQVNQVASEVKSKSLAISQTVSQLESQTRSKQGEMMATVNQMSTGARASLAEANRVFAMAKATLNTVSKIEEAVKAKLASAEAAKKSAMA